MNLETKITIYKFTPQVFTLTPNCCYIEKQTIFVESCKRQTYIVDVFR